MQLRPVIIWNLALSGLLLITSGGLASTSIQLSSLWQDCGSINSSSNLPVEGTCATNWTNQGASGQLSHESSAAWARAEVGWLRLTAQGATDAQSPLGSWGGQGDATAVASWQDSLTVSAGAGLAGQPGQLTATIVIDGQLTLGGGDPYAGTGLANGAASYFYVQASMQGVMGTYGGSSNFAGGVQLRYVSGGGTASSAYQGNLIGPGNWQVTFPITFGSPKSLFILSRAISNARAVVYSAADGLRQGQSSSDFTAGVRWAGITEVRTTNGTVVADYTVSSASGFDYAAGASPAPPYFTEISLLPGAVELRWTDSLVRSYTVETTGVLPSTNWIPVPGLSWPISTKEVTIPFNPQTNTFVRLRTQ